MSLNTELVTSDPTSPESGAPSATRKTLSALVADLDAVPTLDHDDYPERTTEVLVALDALITAQLRERDAIAPFLRDDLALNLGDVIAVPHRFYLAAIKRQARKLLGE